MTSNKLTVHTDGAARGNPGPAAFAYVIDMPDGDVIQEAGCLGNLTNNQAEYQGLIKALEHCRHLGTGYAITLYSDSELMVKQMLGEYRVKDDGLKKLFAEAHSLAKKFASFEIHHVRRGENSQADRLCNEALDGKRIYSGPSAWQPSKQSSKTTESDTSWEQEALAILHESAREWAKGNSHRPDPQEVWKKIKKLAIEGKEPGPK